MNDNRQTLTDAWTRWLVSEAGRAAMTGKAQAADLETRLYVAFVGGIRAATNETTTISQRRDSK
jgi:hypothetical protein